MSFSDNAKKKLSGLMIKCIENDLRIEYIPASKSLLVMDKDYRIIASIWIDENEHLKGIEWLQDKVNKFIREELRNETSKVTEFKVG